MLMVTEPEPGARSGEALYIAPSPLSNFHFLNHTAKGGARSLSTQSIIPQIEFAIPPNFSMNRPKIVTVFHGEVCLGEAEVFPGGGGGGGNQHSLFHFPNNEIRISHLTPPSERCPPLAVLHSVSPSSVPFKIKARALAQDSPFSRLYIACFQERKTAVVPFGDQELHLVAMPSKTERSPCFWCCSIRAGLYNSCMWMLNLRCLAIVFDLDETLIVANTMRSFEDRIAALSHRIDSENDPVRVSGMSAELKRCVEDREMLKQYIENDTVMDNGRLIGVQREHVPPLPGSQETVMRPVIRLPEKNVVLTRINPEIRDTSVFVRLRPAWDDLRSYLTAKGRKRFEVYVCTLAERDYALEMWRLLDPEAHLIGSKQLLDRITCVKSGFRKSLQHVFRDGNCHPKMAMVIDDRLQVWVDTDQPRVHVVPPFAPYYAPQAEMATAVPVLCVARNVACNVRGGFFKEFDDNLLKRIYEICYENEILDLPNVADVSNYLMPEDTSIPNRDPSIPEGMTGVDVERRFRPGSLGDERQAQHQAQPTHSSLSGDELSKTRLFTTNGERKEVGSLTPLHSSLFIAVLQEIGRKCDSKVEFRSIIGTSKEFHFHFEVLFNSERIGIGMGRTMKEAQLQAAENALRNLASKYISFIAPSNGGVDREFGKLSLENENGFLEDIVSPRDEPSKKEGLYGVNMSEHSEKLTYVLSAIKEHCAENQSIVFVDQAPASVTLNEGEHYFQVELAGEVIAKGVGVSREEAKLKASEEALRTLKTKRSAFAPLTKRPKESREREGEREQH